jgi:hypothetical protein
VECQNHLRQGAVGLGRGGFFQTATTAAKPPRAKGGFAMSKNKTENHQLYNWEASGGVLRSEISKNFARIDTV